MDFYPTLCDLAGIHVKHETDGVSLLPFLMRGDDSGLNDRTLFWVRREGGPTGYQGRAYYAVRRGPWKLEQSTSFAPMELYNLDDDPLEMTPLDDRKITAELGAALMLHIQEVGKIPWQKK
tara:strand:- start:746 stop:1108 length:363 start_codon:yes stop_codon:yes gene_type:complete